MTSILIEYKRQSVHIIFGLVIISLLFLLGRDWTMILLLFGLFFLLFYSKNTKFMRSLKNFLVMSFERSKDDFYFKGAIYYLIGMLIAISFTNNITYSIVLIGILSVSDGLATVLGLHGNKKILWNSKKSVLGTIAFIASSLLVSSIFLNLYQAIVISVFLGVIETLPLFFDDNLLIPLAGVILLALI